MDGILIVDKPKGMTSREVVDVVGTYLKTKKIGHTGTLDPNATGVLVLCVGKALKLVDYLTSKEKVYLAEVIFGIKTDTLDITGNVLETKNVKLDDLDLLPSILPIFLGKSMQEVPIYSSVKVKGKKLYEYARNKEEVCLPQREIAIFNLTLEKGPFYKNDYVSIFLFCHVSKGTYIRSLARDIGKKLFLPSCMGDLRRIKQGNFSIEDAYTLEQIQRGSYQLLSLESILKDEKCLVVDQEVERKVRNGQILPRFCEEEQCVLKNQKGELLAIYRTYEKEKNKMKPYRMF